MSEAENPNDSKTQRDPASVRLEPTANDVAPISGESVSPNSIEGLFLRALRLESPAEREGLIRDACGDDVDRIQRVNALLRAYEDAGSFLETPVGGLRATQEISLSFLKTSDKEGILGTIGPYEVLETIGRGGMGVVMRAVDPKLNRVVAVKALLPELAANPNSRRRFLREAQAAAAISHPHVVTIHAVDDSDQEHSGSPVPPYLVMECVIGQSLQQKLDRIGPLRLAEILRISRQIGDGLAAAHKQGLIHRDIKPANILLENGVERVKITDFGLARAIDDITVTRTGEVCGTPQYMSPEQACGERVDHRSDLFSLGCVMYAMCTGHSPFRGDSIAHVIKRVTQDTPRPIAEQNSEIPSWLIDIIDSLLQKDQEQRFQSAEGLVVILDQHLSRIQHPTESGSHSGINQQIPADGSTQTAKTNEPISALASEKVSMQFGSINVPIPLATAIHYTAVKSFGRAWILLTFVGVIFSFVMHPSLSLAANTAQMLSQALQIPAFLFGTWIMGMLGTKIFRPNQFPLRTWVLTSSSMLACMAFGYFWATVVRMPFSGNLNEISSRTLIGAAILPTLIGLMYCGYVFREITKNPESKQGLQNLTGQNARLSFGTLLVLVISILMTMGLVAFMFYFSLQSTVDEQIPVQEVPEIVKVDKDQPSLILTHPNWGKIRTILVNSGGSTRQERSKTETVIFSKPALLGSEINIHVILMDGREWSRYGFPLERLRGQIVITDNDLELRERSLVEVVEDAPGVKLRMVGYPTQHISVNEFEIHDPPFHKALEPGEHRIVLDYVLDEWELPDGIVQYNKLDYRVKVLDDKPLKLSLKEIIEQHGAEAKTTRMTWKPDYKPLTKDQAEVDAKSSEPKQLDANPNATDLSSPASNSLPQSSNERQN